MTRAQIGSRSRDLTIDSDDVDAESRERRVNDLGATRAERPDDHLRVDARADHDAVAALLSGGDRTTRRSMMRVVAIEEADQDVGVEGYCSHSSRNCWR